MDKYLKNLTDNLIGKHRLHEEDLGCPMFDAFDRVRNLLYGHEVVKMNPETLGRVMCSIPPRGVVGFLHSDVTGKELLQLYVANALTKVIQYRLWRKSDRRTWPAYKKAA